MWKEAAIALILMGVGICLERMNKSTKISVIIPSFRNYRGPGSISATTRKKVVFLERGPLSLVSTIEELLDRKVAAPV
jgi:hypothetical protein